MYAYESMGMRIEEWGDGRVNIGVAVRPKPATTTVSGRDTLLSNRKIVVPNSAFVIRTPKSHQSQGVSITYGHRVTGTSDLIIMLSPKSQDQGEQEDGESQLSTVRTKLSNMKVSPNAAIEQNYASPGEGSQAEDGEDVNNLSKSSSVEHQNSSTGKSGEGTQSPGSPQESHNIGESVEVDNAEQTSKKESSSEESRKLSDMKRVSWVDESEILGKKEHNGSNYTERKRERKRESGRKSNGHGSRSPSKKQNGLTLDTPEVVKHSGKRSGGGDSRIPELTGGHPGDFQASCDFYRRKMLNELYSNPADNWYGPTSIQRYAGQKVVRKIAAEQKRLEEDMSNRRKTEIWILGGSDMDDFMMSPTTMQFRKKTTRLKPLQIVQ